MRAVLKKWYWWLAAAVVLGEAAVFLFFGEGSYIAVHDNLDLFMGHFQAMKHSGTFWAQNGTVPILGGITRDYLSSEFSLYNILFWLLPPFPAYLCGYFLKIGVALFSVILLAKDIYGEKKDGQGRFRGTEESGPVQKSGDACEAGGVSLYHRYRPAVVVCGLIYGLLPVFPAYGIAFASIPLVICLLRRIYRGESRWDYLWLFFYPLLSYFSYFGFFILGYLAVAVLILWVRDTQISCRISAQEASAVQEAEKASAEEAGRISVWRFLSLRLLAALIVLALGYILFEYRLFREMLFSDTVSMRSTMADDNFTAVQILSTVWEVFTQAIFHAQPSHTRFVLPLCLLFLAWRIFDFIRKGEWKKIFTDSFCLVICFILGNCLIYGFYYWEGFRKLFETLLPPMKGFQFNRTVFFNPFLWYGALFLIVKYLYDHRKKWLGNLALLAALAVVVLTPAVYNDFYSTCYYNAYRILKHTPVENLNYREFYSEELFDRIKKEIGYDGSYSIAYGMHPAVLSYNGIATLDGYLGFYSQQYKENFGAMIAPATSRVQEWDTYFWDWGARAYIFSGSGENTWNAVRTMQVADDRLYIDGDMFRRLGGKYLFSRISISNAEELGFHLLGAYSGDGSPYTIYVYEQ